MHMIYFIISVISCVVGYSVGRLSYKLKYKNENPQQTILVGDSILLDANDNREIASIANDSSTTEKTKILGELTEIVNKAALDGRTFVCIDREYTGLNKRISKYLTKDDVLGLFDKSHYNVDFMWFHLDDSDINRISW